MDNRALYKISYGMYVVTSGKETKCNGQIANTVFQVTSEPPTIAVAINKDNYTHSFIRQSRVFAVSILSKRASLQFIGNFGFKCGRNVDKFAGANYKIGRTGTRVVLDNAVAYLEAEVINEFDAGTHTIFIGRLVEAETLSDEEPMTYSYYHEVKRGTTPQAAPTYVAKEKAEEKMKMAKYRCTICGYIYDPEKGDPETGIEPGTPFEKLPDSWVCPLCGAAKDLFEKTD
jgi:flavin reductase (DIM6/NTAB) family NADH-FMN oxidoreductase RutF/rubredoxin